MRTGEELFKVHCQDLDPQAQRPIQWTFDEALLAYIVTNEVKFFAADRPSTLAPVARLHVKTVAQFALAPQAKPYQLATFIPSKGTDPAKVNIYLVPTPASTAAAAAAVASASGGAAASSSDSAQAIASKSFYKAEEVSLKWSPTGHALLIETRTATDKTGTATVALRRECHWRRRSRRPAASGMRTSSRS